MAGKMYTFFTQLNTICIHSGSTATPGNLAPEVPFARITTTVPASRQYLPDNRLGGQNRAIDNRAKKGCRDQSPGALTKENRIVQIPEMGITGDDPVAPGSGCGEDDGIGNPAFEPLMPEFAGKDCNGFCYREDEAPDPNLRNDHPDILRILPLLVKELDHLGERDC